MKSAGEQREAEFRFSGSDRPMDEATVAALAGTSPEVEKYDPLNERVSGRIEKPADDIVIEFPSEQREENRESEERRKLHEKIEADLLSKELGAMIDGNEVEAQRYRDQLALHHKRAAGGIN